MGQVPRFIRRILLVLLVLASVSGIALLLGTEPGRQILHNPHHHGQRVHLWVTDHKIVAPIAVVSGFVVLCVLALPVWWLMILAGYGFGLTTGILWCEVGSVLGALAAASLSRILLIEWFHKRVEAHMARLYALDQKLGHNGLLVVSAVRLAHIFPAGLSNYAFGLTRISLIDVALGTLIGGVPMIVIYVALGARPHLLANWHFVTLVAGINLFLMAPVALRYVRPGWFAKIGIE